MDGSRPGYRGDDAYGGGTTAGGSRADSPGDRGDGPATGPGALGDQGGSDYGQFVRKAKANVKIAPEIKRAQEGISSFDPKITQGFAPTKKNPFSLKNIATNVVLGVVAPQLLGPKFAAGMSAYNTAKTISNLAQAIGLTDTNVIDAFTSNLTNKLGNINTGRKPITTTSLDEDLSKGGGGLESLGNIDALNEEYLLLLNKFNSGVFTDADQIRFTFLKNMLGK
jgi:hypothetical protein